MLWLLETKKSDIDKSNDNSDKSKYTPGISWVFDFDEEGSRVIHRNGGGSVIRISPLKFGDTIESTSVSLKKVNINSSESTLDEFLTDFEVEEASIKTSTKMTTTTTTTTTEAIPQIQNNDNNNSNNSSDNNITNQSAISTFMDELEDLISS